MDAITDQATRGGKTYTQAANRREGLNGGAGLSLKEPEQRAVKQDWAECTTKLRSINQQGFYSTRVTLFVKGLLKERPRLHGQEVHSAT